MPPVHVHPIHVPNCKDCFRSIIKTDQVYTKSCMYGSILQILVFILNTDTDIQLVTHDNTLEIAPNPRTLTFQ